MSRMILILFALALVFASAPAAVHAGVAEDSIVEQLKDQGFKRMRITRTLLGRTRIVATSPEIRREIVVNPATGEILRDYSVRRSDGSRSSPHIVNPFVAASGGRGASGAPGGGGTGGYDDPDEEDEADDSGDESGSDGGDDDSSEDPGDSGDDGDDDEADTD